MRSGAGALVLDLTSPARGVRLRASMPKPRDPAPGQLWPALARHDHLPGPQPRSFAENDDREGTKAGLTLEDEESAALSNKPAAWSRKRLAPSAAPADVVEEPLGLADSEPNRAIWRLPPPVIFSEDARMEGCLYCCAMHVAGWIGGFGLSKFILHPPVSQASPHNRALCTNGGRGLAPPTIAVGRGEHAITSRETAKCPRGCRPCQRGQS